MVNIKHLSKAKVLAALYNNARLYQPGVAPEEGITENDASTFLDADPNITWLLGKQIHISFDNDEIDTSLYNYRNGEGRAETIIANLEAEQLRENNASSL